MAKYFVYIYIFIAALLYALLTVMLLTTRYGRDQQREQRVIHLLRPAQLPPCRHHRTSSTQRHQTAMAAQHQQESSQRLTLLRPPLLRVRLASSRATINRTNQTIAAVTPTAHGRNHRTAPGRQAAVTVTARERPVTQQPSQRRNRTPRKRLQ